MRCLGLVLAVLVLGGCGQEHSSARPGGSPATSTSAAQVEGVRAGADPATVVVDVRLPAGAEGCGRDPRATVLEESAATIWFNVVFTRSHADAYPDPCATWEVVEVPVRLAQPLGSRHVAVNGMGLWARHGSDFRRCDETLGCTPPTDHCDPLWVDRAVLGMDVPVKRLREGGDSGRPLVLSDPDAPASKELLRVVDTLTGRPRGLAGMSLGLTPAGR
jgi:hypothetical protein